MMTMAVMVTPKNYNMHTAPNRVSTSKQKDRPTISKWGGFSYGMFRDWKELFLSQSTE